MTIRSKPYYAHTTRLLIELFDAGELPNITAIEIEPEYGHIGRITYRNGRIRMYRGGRTSINPHGSSLIAKDKGYSKYFLRHLGYITSDWQTFITDDYARRINANLQDRGKIAEETPHQALKYIDDTIGYPCYLKPNEGSQGRSVYRCETQLDAQRAIAEFIDQRIDVFIVEQAIDLPDYRVVVFDGVCIATYARRPLSIEGDGQHNLAELLTYEQTKGREQGRKMVIDHDDSRIIRRLAQLGYDLHSIPDAGQRIQVYDVANLSLGGMMDDVTDVIHPDWQTLCANITRDMDLRLCGLDLACADITQPDAEYSIIEINASPGMENYAAMGAKQAHTIRQLYQRIFNELPDERQDALSIHGSHTQ